MFQQANQSPHDRGDGDTRPEPGAQLVTIDRRELEVVFGSGFLDDVDAGVAKVFPSWPDKACAARGSWVNWTWYTTTGALSWATWNRTRALGQAVAGPLIGLGGTTLYDKYINNCEKQKAAGAATKR